MNPLHIAAVTLVSLPFLALAADAPKGFATESVNIGYLPESALAERVKVEDLAEYLKKLQATCTEFFADTTTPENLDVVTAVTPRGQTRVWLVSARKKVEKEKQED